MHPFIQQIFIKSVPDTEATAEDKRDIPLLSVNDNQKI